MKALYICIVLFFSCHSMLAQNQPCKDSILKKTREFCALIKAFSALGEKPDQYIYSDISALRDSTRDFNTHADDLFDTNANAKSAPILSEYLNKIILSYNQQIDVEFTNITALDCIDSIEGIKYVMAQLTKTLVWKGQKRIEEELVIFNLKNYKISEIAFLKDYKDKRSVFVFVRPNYFAQS